MERGQLNVVQYGQNVPQQLHFHQVCYCLLLYNEGCPINGFQKSIYAW